MQIGGVAMQAYAYVVGPEDGPGAALMDMAKGLGFAGVDRFGTLAQAEQQMMRTPVCFFLFAATDEVSRLRGAAEQVRFAASRRTRFSPLIYFSESPSVEAITTCLGMGFDDIITMPFLLGRVADRVRRQIGRTLVYYETASYFGPDRRGRVPGESDTRTGRRTGGQFRRLEIVRSLTDGIRVLRDELVPVGTV